jgi:hypothetical protein
MQEAGGLVLAVSGRLQRLWWPTLFRALRSLTDETSALPVFRSWLFWAEREGGSESLTSPV